jgi:iron complex transport system ATP-binding protein
MMRDGRAIATGPIDEVLTSGNLSECFGMDLEVSRRPNGRFTAFAR